MEILRHLMRLILQNTRFPIRDGKIVDNFNVLSFKLLP